MYGGRITIVSDEGVYHRGMANRWESTLPTTKAINAALRRDTGWKTIYPQRHGLGKDSAVLEGCAQFARSPGGDCIE